MTPHQDDAQTHGDRPGRFDFRRPYLFTFLIVIVIMVVTGASGAWAAVFGLPTRDFELGAEVVLAVLFGLMHSVNVLFGADPAATLRQVGYVTAMGFGFAAVTLRTGVIWPLIVIHGLTNAAGFVTAGGTTSTGATNADVMVSAIYIVGFTIYGVIVLQNAQRPIARPTAARARSHARRTRGDLQR